MIPFDKISEREKNQFQEAVRDYVNDFSYVHSKQGNIKDILQPWNSAKSEYLFKMFGNDLILSRDISYALTTEELEGKMHPLKRDEFFDDFREKVIYHSISTQNSNVRWGLETLIEPYSLASNIYNYESFSFYGPTSGKKIEITKGCKVIKALGKISAEFGISSFEDFRIRHSMILNNKRIEGKLCLSIHPNDYASMSDNEYNWDSCMNWRDQGGYCQGTVEMMNSPMVIVAYIDGCNDNFYFGGKPWTNKKWRELFIVHPDVLIEVAPYPWANKDITDQCLEWIRDLVIENLGWDQFQKSRITDWRNGVIRNEEIAICFESNAMYNDFRFTHRCFTSYDLKPSSTLNINYSGLTECLWCGETDSRWNYLVKDESSLVCENCEDFIVCSQCGDRICNDEYCTLNEQHYCYNCWDYYITDCEMCEQAVHADDTYAVYLGNVEQGWISTEFKVEVCEHCFDTKITQFVDTIHETYHYWSRYYYLDINEINEEGAKFFTGSSKEDLLEYVPNGSYRINLTES